LYHLFRLVKKPLPYLTLFSKKLHQEKEKNMRRAAVVVLILAIALSAMPVTFAEKAVGKEEIKAVDVSKAAERERNLFEASFYSEDEFENGEYAGTSVYITAGLSPVPRGSTVVQRFYTGGFLCLFEVKFITKHEIPVPAVM